MRAAFITLVALSVAFAADITPGDARRGSQLFEGEQCVQCHRVGRPGGTAPDLGRRLGRDYTPTAMAALMWNHAPDMWAAIKQSGTRKPHLDEQDAADLFAYFISARYFEHPGDAGRGKQAFEAKHCASCHGITTSNAEGAPPIAKWESLAEPVVLVQQMWNHGPRMREAFARRHFQWPSLTAQELTDILVYLQNLPETKSLASNFQFPASETGQALFQKKGCSGCHTGKLALETRLRNETLTGIAAAMWNHQPKMQATPPTLTQEEMREILAYIWAKQYFGGEGDAKRGAKVFADKRCGACHQDASSGAPKLAKGKGAYSDVVMVSVLWQHGPKMLESMQQKGLTWPRFSTREMSDLIAYLNSL
jgi:mono/diheme cytochrome c family protein